MKAYKLEVLVIDTDELGGPGILQLIECTKYPNWCMEPKVMDIKERDIGEWTDSHPLNQYETRRKEYKRLFGSEDAAEVQASKERKSIEDVVEAALSVACRLLDAPARGPAGTCLESVRHILAEESEYHIALSIPSSLNIRKNRLIILRATDLVVKAILWIPTSENVGLSQSSTDHFVDSNKKMVKQYGNLTWEEE